MSASKPFLLGALLVSLCMVVPAMALQSPPDCTSNDFVLNVKKSLTVAYVETCPLGPTTIIYTVSAGNPNTSGSGCDVTSMTITLTTPDGVIHPIQTNANYPIGTAVTDIGTVSYPAASADVVGGFLTATAAGTGILNDVPGMDDWFTSTKPVSIIVICPGTEVDIVATVGGVPVKAVPVDTDVTLEICEENTGGGNLTGVHVDFSEDGVIIPLSPPLDKDHPSLTGDTDGDGELDPGETWCWKVVRTVKKKTIYDAIGHGLDALGNDVTIPLYPGEKDEWPVDVLWPGTKVSIVATLGGVPVKAVPVNTEVTLEICEENTGDLNLTGVHVDFSEDGVIIPLAPPLDKDNPTLTGDDGDGVLEPGETWCWKVDRTVIKDTVYDAIGHGLDPSGKDITYPAYEDEKDEWPVDVLKPDTLITISASDTLVCEGEQVTLIICETNTGEVDLTGVHVDFSEDGVIIPLSPPLDKDNPTLTGDDGDGVLEPGETWCWEVDRTVIKDTIYDAIGHGLDPSGKDVTYPAYKLEKDEVLVETEPCGEGCTPGFWKNNADKHGASAWCDKYSPKMTFSAVFGEKIMIFTGGNPNNPKSYIKDPTLLEALGANGGGINALARHAVAALLNACSPCVHYAMGEGAIIDAVQKAIPDGDIEGTKDMFAYNNEAGCPVNQHGECVGVETDG